VFSDASNRTRRDGVSPFVRLHREQQGATTAIVAVCLVAFIGAAMITVDAGSLWSSRRRIITGTDASALDAAALFNSGLADPCSDAGRAFAETNATTVLTQNHPSSLHDASATPNGFAVTLADPSKCFIGGYTPGKVRFDGRLPSQGFFSGFFGLGNQSALSSSTAAWGYIAAIGNGLRPISICDSPNSSSGFQLYVQYWNGLHGRTPSIPEDGPGGYDSYWGTNQGTGTEADPGRFPRFSSGFPSGDATVGGPNKINPNYGLQYTDPALDSRFHTVHRVINPDPACGIANGDRDWVDLRGADINGVPGASNLEDWLLHGYPGTVALSPHDCNTADGNTNEDCGSAPGNRNSLMDPLHELTCPVDIPSPNCKYRFPILVVSCVGELDVNGICVQVPGTGGENAHYVQVAFIFVVLRGYGKIDANTTTVGLDLEFTDVQTSGEVTGSPPTDDLPYQTGTQLCGADHDGGGGDRCPF
jgi:hypothetical protein